MRAWILVLVFGLAAAAFPITVAAADCNPYPVGRCGHYDREMVNFCYWTVGGLIIDATDKHVVALGTTTPTGVALPDNNAKGVLYVRLAPSERFAGDPYESDLPFETLVLETNTIRGVQLAPFKCANFIWYAECDSWMGPYNILPAGAASYAIDRVIA